MRTRNSWGQGERLRAEILQAASRLLGELGGEEGLTIRGVARAVGIAPASIYAHFTDKDDLVRAVVAHEFEQLAAYMSAAEERVDPNDAFGRLRARLQAYCSFAMDNPSHYRLMVAFRLRAADSTGPRAPEAGSTIESLAEALEHCEAAGLTVRLPVRRAAVMLFVSVHGRVALWHARPDVGPDAHAFVDELLALVVASAEPNR